MLEVKGVRCGYDNKEIVKGVSFNIERGNNLCIVGPNGCGKSTLLKSIANLLEYKGNITLDSKEISQLNRKDLAKNVALMSQASNIYFPYTVYETVALGRYAHLKGVFSKINKKDEEIILKSIENVGLIDIKDKLISQLSGGQLQRVYLARAFAQDPDIILLDEPTNHLDIKYQMQLLNIVKDLDLTIVAAIHDLNIAAMYCDRLFVMKNGKIVGSGTPQEVLTKEFIKEIYDIDVEIVNDSKGDMHILYSR